MIRKFFVVLLCFLYMPVFAQSYSTLDKIEDSLFGMTYSGEGEKSRIERLEKNIYGKVQNGNLQTRFNTLSKDISADLIGQEIEPTKYTEFEEQEDNTVEYPIIDEIERQTFNKVYKNKKLEKRLSDLEQKIFKKTYSNDDLNTRTERLKIAVPTHYDYNQFGDNLNDYNALNNFDFQKFNIKEKTEQTKTYDKNVGKILTALEKKILKKTYLNEDEETRTERLEENMFNTSFPNDNIEARLERLALAYQATKTSKKYDTNKLSQHMATAMQVGMFLLMILAMVL